MSSSQTIDTGSRGGSPRNKKKKASKHAFFYSRLDFHNCVDKIEWLTFVLHAFDILCILLRVAWLIKVQNFCTCLSSLCYSSSSLSVFFFFLFLLFKKKKIPTTGHGIMADGSVGTGSSVIAIPIAGLGDVTFLAFLKTSHVIFVFGLSLQM